MALSTSIPASPAREPRAASATPDLKKEQAKQRQYKKPDQRPDHEHDQDPFARHEPDDGRDTVTRPRLFIPSYDNDVGERNGIWPPGALSYKSKGLKIERPDGSPYLGGTIPRYAASTVRVVVANGSPVPADAQVALYWTNPSAGFGPPHLRRAPVLGPPQPIHVASFATEITQPIALQPIALQPIALQPHPDTPDHIHICLIAVVSAFDDSPSGTWDPLNDRHYAQHNVDIVHVQAGGIGIFQFHVTNPYAIEAEITVQLRSANAAELRVLSMTYAAEAREVSPGALRMIAHADEQGGRIERVLRLRLLPGERQLCQGLLSTEGLGPGQIAAVEVQTSARPLRSERASERCGSYGVVFFVEQ